MVNKFIKMKIQFIEKEEDVRDEPVNFEAQLPFLKHDYQILYIQVALSNRRVLSLISHFQT